MQKPRTRFVSLRMTEEEYYRLRGAAEGHGARSVSDFARVALLATAPRDEAIASEWREPAHSLAGRVARVEHEIAEIKDILSLKVLTHDPIKK